METKPAYASKTLWVNFLAAALALGYPPAKVWVDSHPEVLIAFFAAVNIALRFITKGKIELG